MNSLARLCDPRVVKVALIIVGLVYVIAHVTALFSDGIHWDELVLFRRAEIAAQTGVLDGGGRPGLGVALLVPAVDGCRDTFAMVLATRFAWAASTLALLAGLFVFLLQATRRSELCWHAAAIGTAALAFVPLFLRWSLQIRTDQPAAACAMWGGVALFASAQRPWIGWIAGALFGVGYLLTQKAVYLTALVGLVFVGDLYIERAISWRRELIRAAWMLGGAIAVLVAYRVIMPLVFSPPATSLEAGFDLLDWYRRILRFRLYPNMVSSVIPQIGLLVLVLVAALRAMRRDTEQRRPLLVALAVVVLGFAVGRFHTGSFPHFWITLGVFPATAIGLGWPGIRALLPRAHVPVATVCWLWLIVTGSIYRAETLEDTQGVQRAAFHVVDNLDAGLRGFSSDGAFVCRRDPAPLPVYLGQGVSRRLGGKDGERKTAALVEEFKSRPIAFVLDTHRLTSFPEAWMKFYRTHYVPYAHRVSLAGQPFAGPAGSKHTLDVIVPGTYRWIARGGTPARVIVEGTHLDRGQTVILARGEQSIQLIDPIGDGMLVLAVEAPPAATEVPFYSEMVIFELAGIRKRYW